MRKIPTVLFVNKIDRVGADIEAVLHEIRKELTINFVVLQTVANEGNVDAALCSIIKNNTIPDETLEAVATSNDMLLEKYLSGEKIEYEMFIDVLRDSVAKSRLIPVFMGSAKTGVGVKELLDAVTTYIPEPASDSTKPLSALVFGIEHDKIMGKVAMVRVFQGSASNRETVEIANQSQTHKVTQIRKQYSGKYNEIQTVSAGEIVGICGLHSVNVGDILGETISSIPNTVPLHSPLLTVQIKAQNEKDYPALAEALTIMNSEDPSLELEWLREERELNLKIMGWIQMEIIESMLESRFQIKATFEKPTVIYKETPTKAAEGFVQYWMPKPCWAVMRFRIEPLEPGSGVQFESRVSVDKIQQKYQNEVERTIPKALEQGIKGWEVTDLRITLIDGEDHVMHTRPGDFVVASPMGIMDGLTNSGTTLLEPILAFKISASEELLGAITGDIHHMRGRFDSPTFDNGKFFLTGFFPLANSIDYPVTLSSRSGGKAKISTTFHGYQPCSDELGVIRPYKGISPLDTAKYILKARRALL
jgi:ribosomal protection tetracycline resistance protein